MAVDAGDTLAIGFSLFKSIWTETILDLQKKQDVSFHMSLANQAQTAALFELNRMTARRADAALRRCQEGWKGGRGDRDLRHGTDHLSRGRSEPARSARAVSEGDLRELCLVDSSTLKFSLSRNFRRRR
jgi:hypothetical protein